MIEWYNFLEKLKEYEPNTGTLDLRTIIEKTNETSPSKIEYRGEYWLKFTSIDNNFQIKFNPENKRIVTTKKNQLDHDVEEIVYAHYQIGLFDDMYIQKEEVINQYVKVTGGYQLLLESNETTERFTKTGFQKSNKTTITYCPYFIFRSDVDRAYCDFVIPKKMYLFGNEGFMEHLKCQEINREYYLSSSNYSIKASFDEINSLVVFFKNNENDIICFPAFFYPDKTIYVESFINDPSLQYSAAFSSGYDDDVITFEGRTMKDFENYKENRYKLVGLINSCNKEPSLKKTLESISRF